MIKQLISKELEEYIKNNPKTVLLDVRTKEEWNNDGKPNGDKIGVKTYFLSIGENFINEFKNLNIDRNNEILIMCAAGTRSQIASQLLTQENFNCSNISDGFLGNQEDKGWKNSGLPWE